jgi:hypothetical protein
MLSRILSCGFIMGVLGASLAQESQIAASQGAPLRPILDVFDKTKRSGSLEFTGRCVAGHVPDLPHFRLPVTFKDTATETLREMLPNDRGMTVTQDSSGIIRMIESGVEYDMLNVRIQHISFGDLGTNKQGSAYNPNDALDAILNAPEVTEFMKAHDIQRPGSGAGVHGNQIGTWPPEQPHISGSLDNVTVSEALDQVLMTFPGMWVYEDCPKGENSKREVYFGFFYLQRIGANLKDLDLTLWCYKTTWCDLFSIRKKMALPAI